MINNCIPCRLVDLIDKYCIEGNIYNEIKNYQGDKTSWVFVSLVLIAYYMNKFEKIDLAEYLNLNIDEVDDFLEINSLRLLDFSDNSYNRQKIWEERYVQNIIKNIKTKYTGDIYYKYQCGAEKYTGKVRHEDIKNRPDMWKITCENEDYKHNELFNAYVSKLLKEASESGFNNVYVIIENHTNTNIK